MKKKLRLNELKVQSFVTAQSVEIKGGTTGDILNTKFSCLDYISCNPLQCIYSNNGICLEP